MRGKWVLKGKPALVDSNSPRYGEKASYYSAVCLETGEVEWMELEGNSNSGTSVAFLTQLRGKHPGPLRVIWDNAPAHRREAVREYLRRPGLELRLVNLPGYSPDFNADEAVWGWCERGGHWQSVLGQQGGGTGTGRQIPGRAGWTERRGETALPDGPAIKGRNTPARLPPRFPAPGKCTSHFGFSLVLQSHILAEEFQSALVVAAAGSCLVSPPPPGPRQHRIVRRVGLPDQPVDEPSHFRNRQRYQGLIPVRLSPPFTRSYLRWPVAGPPPGRRGPTLTA